MSQRAVMCDECQKWSHLACARGIEHPDAKFLCHNCAPTMQDSLKEGSELRRSHRM
jgi:hypothetical protein